MPAKSRRGRSYQPPKPRLVKVKERVIEPELEFPEPGTIYTGDALEIMKLWPKHIFDHCITDPPFGISKKQGLGWAFSSHITMQESWDRFASREAHIAFTRAWISEITRLVKPNGNILIFGTYHNIYLVGSVLQELGLKILNSIIWFKPNAQPNITRRTLTESTEQIIWAVNNTVDKATGWTFNYWTAKEIGNGKQLRNVWQIPYTPLSEKRYGKHATQKPETVLDRLIRIATKEGDLILDCFSGTGTTGVVAQRLNRHWVMIEREPAYNEIALKRLAEVQKILL